MADPRPRRPEERRRDPERTQRALLDAALVEFAEKGRAGARVSEIAARAGVNKQLISYYFGGKDGLYRALAERWFAAEAEFAPAELPLDELAGRYVTSAVEHHDMYRLFLRESLEDAPQPEFDGETDDLADMERRRREGEIAEDLDPACVYLVLQAAAAVAISFPGDVRRLTGMDPRSPEFAEHHAEQLRRIVRRLAR